MPNRIIREGWLDSDPINTLDANAERFFLRLCLRADDFGRFHANPLLLKASLFPLVESVKTADLPKWVAACENAGLLTCYEVDGKRFLFIPKFGQRSRANTSKFPPPPANDGQTSDTRPTDDRQPRTYSETETDSKSETKAAPAPSGAPRVEIPMLLATEEFKEVWAKWKAHRTEIRQPLKPTSEKAQLDELELMGVDRAVMAIRWTIFKGWRGLREPGPEEARQFQPKHAPKMRLVEPLNWQNQLKENFPDSRVIREGAIARQWSELSDYDQKSISEALKSLKP